MDTHCSIEHQGQQTTCVTVLGVSGVAPVLNHVPIYGLSPLTAGVWHINGVFPLTAGVCHRAPPLRRT